MPTATLLIAVQPPTFKVSRKALLASSNQGLSRNLSNLTHTRGGHVTNQFSVEKNARGETDAAVRDHLSIPEEQPCWPPRRAAITVLIALIPVPSREEQLHPYFQYLTWSRMPWGRACRHVAHFPSPTPFLPLGIQGASGCSSHW